MSTILTSLLFLAVPLPPASLEFRLQSNLEPWPEVTCDHKKSDVGLYGWDLLCVMDGSRRRFSVHLVVDFYERTRYGKSAYEVLYWVTDFTDPWKPVSTSTTVWVHNATETKATVLELAQGVDGDLKSLRLGIMLPAH